MPHRNKPNILQTIYQKNVSNRETKGGGQVVSGLGFPIRSLLGPGPTYLVAGVTVGSGGVTVAGLAACSQRGLPVAFGARGTLESVEVGPAEALAGHGVAGVRHGAVLGARAVWAEGGPSGLGATRSNPKPRCPTHRSSPGGWRRSGRRSPSCNGRSAALPRWPYTGRSRRRRRTGPR